MANKFVATAGAVISVAMAVLWLITLSVPWDWIWSQNAVVIFKVNLFSIYIDKGLGGMVLAGVVSLFSTKAGNALDSLFKQSLWMETGVQQLCMPGIDTIWHWCDTWTMVKVGSLIMVILGYLVVLLFASGGAFMYYYANVHATKTGRMWVLTCLIGAPVCAVLGLVQYIVLTFQMGTGERQFVATEASYGPGFFLACMLTFFSFVPLCIQIAFVKVDLYEKDGDDDFGPEAGPAYGAAPSYGAMPPAPGYGVAPEQAYGGYPGGPPPQSSYGMMPPQPGPGIPAPGSGAAPMPPPPGGFGAMPPPGAMAAPMPGSGAPAW